MVATKKLKKYVTDMTLRLGPVTTNGSLIPIRASIPVAKKAPFKMVSPSGEKVTQRYVTEGGDTFYPGELKRAYEAEDGSLVIMEADEAKEAKSSGLPKNVLSLVAHEAAEVDARTYPSDKNAYVFVPNDKDPSNKVYADLLTAMLAQSDKALVGLANIRNTEGMYRLSLWRGNIVIQQQLYPESINDHEAVGVNTDLADKAIKVVDKIAVPFDPEMYRDTSEENIARFAAEYEASEGEVAPTKGKTDALVDIVSALDAFLED